MLGQVLREALLACQFSLDTTFRKSELLKSLVHPKTSASFSGLPVLYLTDLKINLTPHINVSN